ncbi:ABI family, member 3 (NESH) binding protein b isoform X1 [Pygocentrus nattereri]|uniref:Fibronectin type-III domain-containing protein n=1 Tax=Pygocentrus nattereri TaxID=42514 RepID=A0A3B4EM67_PYGNA|nr:ABI family, member 3 (NESH) binding protein b isoform X1 [Pygocentrus nattereri]
MALSALLRPCFLLLFAAGILLLSLSSAQRIRVRRQNMKVRINATGDTIVLKFLKPNPETKLEGYILGYGSSMFSKQFIQLPENGIPYETEIDAEPKYLVAVQPIPTNDVKKQCTGKVNLDKPLHLVIGSVTPTSVLLSWGTFVKTPYEGNIMNDCLEDGFYTIRYRERNRKWIYQTCPTSDTVIDNLKPNTAYEFGVRPNKDDRSGMWSKAIIHNTNMGDKSMQKPYKHSRTPKPVNPVLSGHRAFFNPRPAVHDKSNKSTDLHPLHTNPAFPGAPRTSFAPPPVQQETALTPSSNEPKWPQRPLDSDSHARNASSELGGISPALPNLPSTQPPRDTTTTTATTTTTQSPSTGDPKRGLSQTRAPIATHKPHSAPGKTFLRHPSLSVPPKPFDSIVAVNGRNQTAVGRNPFYPFFNGMRPPSFPRANDSSSRFGVNGEHHKGFSYPKPVVWSRNRMANNSLSEDVSPVAHSDTGRSRAPVVERFYGSPARPPFSPNKKTNIVGKPTGLDKTIDLRQAILKPKVPPVSAKPTKPKTTPSPLNATRFETWENSSVFSSIPASKVDAMGKERFIAPHVVYKTDKKPDEPCSITTSLSYFPEDEATETNVTGPPRTAPSNLTVVTVEGCPSFIILDWEKTDNETTEYEVISTTKGPDGEKVSILTTNQTHTAVENLKPESSYEFKVKPKNELGEGPPSEPVSFNTESADPRVSENVSGKDAIWTQFPFKTDSYSECNGKQYVKRTWYRKFVGIQLCNSLRYKIYLSDSLNGKFYNIGDQTGHGEDHCQFVDSFLDGRTGTQLPADQLPTRTGFYRAVRQEPVHFGQIGGNSHVTYVAWYECGTPIPGKW